MVLTTSLVHYETPFPIPAWSFGLAERALVAVEFALAGVLTAWAWRGCACRVDQLAARVNQLAGRDSARRASPDHSAEWIPERRAAAPVGHLRVVASRDRGDAECPTRLVA